MLGLLVVWLLPILGRVLIVASIIRGRLVVLETTMLRGSIVLRWHRRIALTLMRGVLRIWLLTILWRLLLLIVLIVGVRHDEDSIV